MIDIRKLKELVRLMVDNDLTELNLQDQAETVTVKRGYGQAPMIHAAPVHPSVALGATRAGGDEEAGSAAATPPPPPPPAADSEAGLVAVVSPMVGTFYSAANPDSPPFSAPGTVVSTEFTVCLIEAMKVFNEIKAGVNGTVERVLVQNGQAIEYGQKLFLVRPS